MSQKLAALNSDEMSSLLEKALVDKSFVEKDVMEELLENRKLALDQARKKIQSICYTIDYFEKKLKIFDTYSGQQINSINLPGNPSKYNPDDFDAWGTSAVIIDLQEMQKEGDIPYNKESLYGLAIKDDKSYLYNPAIEKQNLLAITNQYIFGGIPKNKNTSLPYDMYLSPDNKMLCLSNRDEGKVYIFDINTSTFSGEINARNSGSNKTINVAISNLNNKIYLTDSLSTNIIIYDINDKNITKKNLGTGILGNICLSPDQKILYLVTTKPEANLKTFRLDTFQETKAFTPKGDLFSIGDDPCDLLTLSSDQKYVLFMTYLNDPIPFTPVITVIEIDKNKAIKRFSIKDETKPINISFREENPFGSVNKTIEELLVEKGLFTFNKLRDIKLSLLEPEEREETKKIIAEQNGKDDFTDLETKSLEFEKRKEEKVEFGVPTPKKVKHIIIPKTANKQITDILVGNFWQRTEIDLTEFIEQKEKLRETSDNIRKKLEYYDMEIVNIPKFFENYTIEAVIQREFILEMLDEEASLDRQNVKTAPSNCINCSSLMLGAWECPACGFVYEKPEDALRKKEASLDHLANLNKGNYFVLDSASGMVMEVDNYKIPIWEVRKEDLELKSLTESIRLDNRNTLILDTIGGAIVEVTPKGRVSWRYDPEDKNMLLNNPLGMSILSNNDLLIADTDNHRVMEMDFDGNVVWQYGVYQSPGIEFNSLNSPVNIEKTYDGTYLITDRDNNRVIELSRTLDPETGIYNIKLVWQYGNSENLTGQGEGKSHDRLNHPTMAFKEMSGNFLILDQGNKRVLEVDKSYNTIFEYNTENERSEYNISNPTRITRLKNRDLLIVGDHKIVELFNSQDETNIVWSSYFEDLWAKTTFRITKETVTQSKAKYGSSSRYGKSKKETIFETQKEVKKKVNANHYMNKSDYENPEQVEIDQQAKILNEIIEKRRSEENIELDKPKVILTKGETVLPIPIVLIDKIDNKIMIVNREAIPIWTYGNYDNEKLNNVLSVEITPQKTVLVVDSKSIFEIDISNNKKVWEYDCNAKSATKLSNGNTLISDEKNLNVYEIDKDNQIVWQYSDEKPATNAVRLSNGNTLITYSHGHIVKEIDHEYNVVWSFGEYNVKGHDDKHLSSPEYASRLKNGNTLISDSRNSRVIEVSHEGSIVWSFSVSGLIKIILPNFAIRLKNGNTYITHANHRQSIEVNHEGKIVWRLIMPSKRVHT
ncbi:MAG: PQQ-binding-like beta-propeller repeat protein [Candidatus Sericytochromatia bacterium]|nr:PQQ-binding-like beta-propeller repeat protein [Candidatus Sericytochromatia bacterium]